MPKKSHRLVRRLLLQCGGVWLLSPAPVRSAEPDTLPPVVRIVLPLPPGGPVDVLLRRLSEPLSAALQRPVIVDNRPGAAGVVGARSGALGAPDGGTIVYLHSGLLTQQAMTDQLDVLSLFQPLIRLHASPYVLVVRAALPARSQAELLHLIRARPGQLNFGSGGHGSPPHLLLARIEAQSSARLSAVHVPYKGGADAVAGMLAGDIDFGFALPGAVAAFASSGGLRVLSVTSAKRLPQFPQWPTAVEAGVPGLVAEPWGGLAVPSGTPGPLVQRLADAVRQAAQAATVAAALQDQGGRLHLSSSPAEFSAFLRNELDEQRQLVIRLGLRAP